LPLFLEVEKGAEEWSDHEKGKNDEVMAVSNTEVDHSELYAS